MWSKPRPVEPTQEDMSREGKMAQYDIDAGIDPSVDVAREMEGPGDLEGRLRAQKGTSGQLAEQLEEID